MKRNGTFISYLFFLFLVLMPLTVSAEVVLQAPVVEAVVVEAVVAVLNFETGKPKKAVIYLSDLERYRLFFEAPENTTINNQDTTTTNKKTTFIRLRDAVISKELFLREALRFAIKKPSTAEILTALKTLRQRFQTAAAFEQALKKSALSLPELKAEIALYLWVNQLLRERIQEFIFISPKAIESYHLSHLNDFMNKEIKVIETQITAILRDKKEVEKKRVYLKRLKEKVQIEFILKENEISQ
ncbi:hypothetical protein MNBD_NITROSPIRAE01-523 [hydrothermal vent metagenome]|uniref:Uncharacterized protein n=1 Tax=hydrothermal vent metagenome TaxID=652676 RepID=A0A3B1CSI0_9ZZZZ